MPLRAFRTYAAIVVAGAAVAVVLLAASGPAPELGDWRLWLFGALVLVGERLPIEVPRGDGQDRVTISAAFAFAALVRFGPLEAIGVYAGASLASDMMDRVSLPKTLFNGAQYALSMAAAAAALELLADGAPITDLADALPAVFGAALAFLTVNHVLAGTGAALLNRTPVVRYLVADVPFQLATSGFLLALAPVVAAAGQVSAMLVPLMLLPAVAIFVGARNATLNAHRASHDALTGVANRLAFAEALDTALTGARRTHRPVALLLVDLDDFKAVNDTLGHAYGDALLRAVCGRLQQAVSDGDVLARLGGDEFAVLPAAGDQAQAQALAERLVRVLETPFALEGVLLDVRASVGIACHPDDGLTAEELLQHADVALYCAKASGSSSVEHYSAEQDDYSVDRLLLAGQLRRGLERGEIIVEYQPKFPMMGGRPDAVEALARWNHPALGRIGPDGFIPLAEHTGLITPLTRVVLTTALRQCRTWRDQGVELRVAVNVSPRSLLDRDLPRLIEGLLAEHHLEPQCLQLEVTESRAVSNRHAADGVLEALRAMGVGVAIDDFGTGFSSLVQLQHLQVDEMKIDRSFVINMSHSASDAAIVRSTIDLARNLGVRVTAEGVETEEVRAKLADMGCDLAQGYHLCRPLPGARCAEAVMACPPRLVEVGARAARA